jgi:hypothetical protein
MLTKLIIKVKLMNEAKNLTDMAHESGIQFNIQDIGKWDCYTGKVN